MSKENENINNESGSEHSGFLGVLENLCRRYRFISFALALTPVLVAYILSISLSLAPCIYLVIKVIKLTSNLNTLSTSLAIGAMLTISIFIFAFSLLFWIIILDKLIPKSKERWRGNWYSVKLIPWYYHNALVLLARNTVLPFFQSTPIINIFYQYMGMKMGKGCIINTVYIQDPYLIELGDYVTIGGSATIFCHYAQKGFFVLAPVKIGSNSTIGLKSSIMGDVEIGENQLIIAHQAVMPKSRIGIPEYSEPVS